MLLLIGIEKDIAKKIEEDVGINVFILGKEAEGKLVKDIVANPRDFEGNGTWHERKFAIMHGMNNEEVKKVLGVFKTQGIKDVIFATTTETSLNWELSDLLNELLEEDEYFKKIKKDK